MIKTTGGTSSPEEVKKLADWVQLNEESCGNCPVVPRIQDCPASSLTVRFWRGADLWSRAGCLEFDLLSQPKCVINFHAQVADGGFDLRVAR